MNLKYLFIIVISCFCINVFSSPILPFVKSKTVSKDKQTVEDYIGMPITGQTGENIAKYMQKQEKQFSSIRNVTIKRIREGEVLEITIPSDQLFINNDSIFSEMSELNLRPILTFMRKGLTDLFITVHTDDTGSEQYLQNLSDRRASAIYNWFLLNKIEKDNIAIQSMAYKNPIFTNDSMENRKNNRRITFYIIPNKNMIKQAKKNKL